MAVRIYVGGLPPKVSDKDVAGRFASFGTVHSCQIIPGKGLDNPLHCRGFSYVDLTPKDEHALARCFSLVRNVSKTGFNGRATAAQLYSGNECALAHTYAGMPAGSFREACTSLKMRSCWKSWSWQPLRRTEHAMFPRSAL